MRLVPYQLFCVANQFALMSESSSMAQTGAHRPDNSVMAPTPRLIPSPSPGPAQLTGDIPDTLAWPNNSASWRSPRQVQVEKMVNTVASRQGKNSVFILLYLTLLRVFTYSHTASPLPAVVCAALFRINSPKSHNIMIVCQPRFRNW